MKKLFFLIIVLFIFAGCGRNQAVLITDKNAPEGISDYDENGVIKRVNEIRGGLTPKMAPSKKSASSASSQQLASATPLAAPEQIKLEDLASQISQAIIKTNFGSIRVGFYGQDSPLTVNNFLNLAKKGFYNETKFYRVIKDFMIQGGDPNSKDDDWSDDGQGGPGYKFQDEINSHKLVKGSLAMANSGPNTNGSQFFIVTAESTAWLDGKHTNFGYVVDGFDTINKIIQVEVNENSHPVKDVIIESVEFIGKESAVNSADSDSEMAPMGPELEEAGTVAGEKVKNKTPQEGDAGTTTLETFPSEDEINW